MTLNNDPNDNLIFEMKDRNKELNCLFTIEETLLKGKHSLDKAIDYIISVLPSGFQYPNTCAVKIVFENKEHKTNNFLDTSWKLSSNIVIQDKIIGEITVSYRKEMPKGEIGCFLKEEEKLLRTVANRLGHFILHTRLKGIYDEIKTVKPAVDTVGKSEWRIVLDMLRKTDPKMFFTLLRKLLLHLLWNGVEGAERLMQLSSIDQQVGDSEKRQDENRPLKKRILNNYNEYIFAILKLAEENLLDDELLAKVQKWIQEAKASGLIKALESSDSSLSEIGDAIRKYYHMAPEKFELSYETIKGLRVSLIRRFFTGQLEFIKIAKEYVKLTDFYLLINNMIYHSTSHGKLGGKSAGMFLASNVLKHSSEESDLLKNIKTPKTWFIASDAVMHFLQHNDLEEILEQKHKDIDEIRVEYPHIIQMFKNSQFPPDMVKGLSLALDEFGDNPLVVRSSSLMEDQMGQAFSGKYKSLFLANQGSKKERLTALMDAVAEVYASTFGPDPLEYRAERDLIDFHEEMGIMIQQVVGTRVGKYYFPAFAGVAFSNNEFRWSSRIKREDGLVRIVPGLGTRAVDRLADDYPILVAPGQPNLRVNITIEEMMKYTPTQIDVIDLEKNEFATLTLAELLKKSGDDYPAVNNIFSTLDHNMVRQVGFDTDFENDEFYATFDGLLNKTNFVKRIREILLTLEKKIESPVDIEFAHDGKDLYLLQCRPQSFLRNKESDPIPKDIPDERVIFSAKRYVSNGKVEDVTHIVYVDPQAYGEIPEIETMKAVGKAVGKLNKALPRRKFILMGPGRWGSRGDIKLGVSVTYSDINNTSMLIEIAKKKGNYVPDLSFGTHFFQDLVEANIQYLPLYPDDLGILFNERFFEVTENKLADFAPEFAHLAHVIKVIDVPASTEGHILKVLLNADLDEALAIITSEDESEEDQSKPIASLGDSAESKAADQWKWRMSMAEKIASKLDPSEFGVKNLYIFGSTQEASADSESDINLLIHIDDDEKCKKESLKNWLQGWSLCLSEMNYLRTGHKTEGLLDINFVTDEDIESGKNNADKITSLKNPAKKLL